ncbi:PREDICTED: translationally-controlled tumor protein homolog [Cariama cristata]|uniref:translationally-controlled tumor protein homolog n=1 Tax=Cariama cristata TaxID=54380 RepID=UPI0005200AAE|nr:PREDICTED: translationally-controlled tumor protein homolog [Cariama cristata]
MVTRTEGQIDDSLIGGNASAEGPEGDGTEATVITGVDIVINHHLQETSFTKESYKKYIKDYMKAIKARLEEHKPERVKPFMTGAAEQIKHILANFKNYQVMKLTSPYSSIAVIQAVIGSSGELV